MDANLWQLGLALGLAVDAGLALALALSGQGITGANWQRCLVVGGSVTVICWQGLPVAVAFARGAWGAFWSIRQTLEDWNNRNLPPAEIDEAPEPEPPSTTAQIDRLERQRLQTVAHWQVYFRRLVAAMFAYGCDRNTLTDPKRATKVTTQPGWNTATRLLAEAGLLVKDNTGTRLLVSESAWNAGRMWERLPAPDTEPPEIDPPPYSTTQPTTAETTANRVIEGVRAE